MAYSVRLYREFLNGNSGSIVIDDDVVVYTNGDIPLVGIGVFGYAESISESLTWQLENFSSEIPPSNPVQGQIWYDRSTSNVNINEALVTEDANWTTLNVEGDQGDKGVQGDAGDDGQDGNSVLNGNSNPSINDGVEGDFWINTNSYTIFGPKEMAGWTSSFSMVGQNGANGADGEIGDAGVNYVVTEVNSAPTTGGDQGDLWVRLDGVIVNPLENLYELTAGTFFQSNGAGFGYVDPTYFPASGAGTMTNPSDFSTPPTFNGVEIATVSTTDANFGTDRVLLALGSTLLAQSFFSTLRIYETTDLFNPLIELDSSSANFVVQGGTGTTFWIWGGATPILENNTTYLVDIT